MAFLPHCNNKDSHRVVYSVLVTEICSCKYISVSNLSSLYHWLLQPASLSRRAARSPALVVLGTGGASTRALPLCCLPLGAFVVLLLLVLDFLFLCGRSCPTFGAEYQSFLQLVLRVIQVEVFP
jgi:hypothetical protein